VSASSVKTLAASVSKTVCVHYHVETFVLY